MVGVQEQEWSSYVICGTTTMVVCYGISSSAFPLFSLAADMSSG